VASLTGRWREPSLSFKSSFKEVFKEVFCCLPSKTPLIQLDDFIDSFWDEVDKELEEATQDDQDDPSVWEQK